MELRKAIIRRHPLYPQNVTPAVCCAQIPVVSVARPPVAQITSEARLYLSNFPR